MANKHLTQAQKQLIVQVIEDCGYAEVLLLIDGLIRREAPPNTSDNWANGSLPQFDHMANAMTSLRHTVYNIIDKKQE